MDGANVEIVEEVGKENAFIFGLSCSSRSSTMRIMAATIRWIYFNNDQDIRRVLMQLINGEYAPDDTERCP